MHLLQSTNVPIHIRVVRGITLGALLGAAFLIPGYAIEAASLLDTAWRDSGDTGSATPDTAAPSLDTAASYVSYDTGPYGQDHPPLGWVETRQWVFSSHRETRDSSLDAFATHRGTLLVHDYAELLAVAFDGDGQCLSSLVVELYDADLSLLIASEVDDMGCAVLEVSLEAGTHHLTVRHVDGEPTDYTLDFDHWVEVDPTAWDIATDDDNDVDVAQD